jgi:hypothetical protein
MQLTSASRTDTYTPEQERLERLREAAQNFEARLDYFRDTSSSAASATIREYMDELHGFGALFDAWRATARRLAARGCPTYGDELEELIARVAYNRETYEFTYRSRVAWESYQASQGKPGPGIGMAASARRPGPGSPEWLDAAMGRRCYWCHLDLVGWPGVVACPNCRAFPKPAEAEQARVA